MDTNIDQEALKRLFARFASAKKAHYEMGWVVLKNFIKHQNLRNSKIVTGIVDEMAKIPPQLREKLMDPSDDLYMTHDETLHLIKYNLIKFNPIKLNATSATPPSDRVLRDEIEG